jgi:hypothetical protein
MARLKPLEQIGISISNLATNSSRNSAISGEVMGSRLKHLTFRTRLFRVCSSGGDGRKEIKESQPPSHEASAYV